MKRRLKLKENRGFRSWLCPEGYIHAEAKSLKRLSSYDVIEMLQIISRNPEINHMPLLMDIGDRARVKKKVIQLLDNTEEQIIYSKRVALLVDNPFNALIINAFGKIGNPVFGYRYRFFSDKDQAANWLYAVEQIRA